LKILLDKIKLNFFIKKVPHLHPISLWNTIDLLNNPLHKKIWDITLKKTDYLNNLCNIVLNAVKRSLKLLDKSMFDLLL
jgi:hypothetical protein